MPHRYRSQSWPNRSPRTVNLFVPPRSIRRSQGRGCDHLEGRKAQSHTRRLAAFHFPLGLRPRSRPALRATSLGACSSTAYEVGWPPSSSGAPVLIDSGMARRMLTTPEGSGHGVPARTAPTGGFAWAYRCGEHALGFSCPRLPPEPSPQQTRSAVPLALGSPRLDLPPIQLYSTQKLIDHASRSTDRVGRTEARKHDTCDLGSVLMIRGIRAIRGKNVSGFRSSRSRLWGSFTPPSVAPAVGDLRFKMTGI